MTDKQKQEITEVERLTIESASWKHAARHLEAERDEWKSKAEAYASQLTRATAGQFGHPEDGGLIERIACAWAYMEGKGGRFDACKADPEQDRTEGYYSGYMAEAEELAKRAGLFPTVAAIRDAILAKIENDDDL